MSNSIIIKVLKDYMEAVTSLINISDTDTDEFSYKNGLYDGTQNVLSLLESMLDVKDDTEDIPEYIKEGVDSIKW